MTLEDMEVIILGIIGGQGGTSNGGVDHAGIDHAGIDHAGLVDGLSDTGNGIGAAALEARAIAAFHDLNPDMSATDAEDVPEVVPMDAAQLEATKAAFTTALAHLIQSDSVAETTTATGETAFRLN